MLIPQRGIFRTLDVQRVKEIVISYTKWKRDTKKQYFLVNGLLRQGPSLFCVPVTKIPTSKKPLGKKESQ